MSYGGPRRGRPLAPRYPRTSVCVARTDTATALRVMHTLGTAKAAALNFANASHPGGGYLHGARAQAGTTHAWRRARGVSRAAAELEELAPIGVLRDSMPYLAVNAELLADDFEYEGPLASGPVRRDAYLDLAARLEREDTA